MKYAQHFLYQNNPTLHGIQITGKRGRLFSSLYTAGGKGLHPVVLLLHGIPGNEQNLDLAQELRRNGFHVLTFHYSGFFGSDGDYTLSHNIEDANTVLDFILQDEVYGFDKSNIFVVGHSMGGFVASHLTAKRNEINGSALLMPCNVGRIFEIEKENTDVCDTLKSILFYSSEWLNGASLEKFMLELTNHSNCFPIENLAYALHNKPILLIEAMNDCHTPPEYHSKPLKDAICNFTNCKLTVLELETDHFASNCRPALCNEVVSYFHSLLEESSKC